MRWMFIYLAFVALFIVTAAIKGMNLVPTLACSCLSFMAALEFAKWVHR